MTTYFKGLNKIRIILETKALQLKVALPNITKKQKKCEVKIGLFSIFGSMWETIGIFHGNKMAGH